MNETAKRFPSLGGCRQYAWDHYVPLDPTLMWDRDMPPRGVCEFGYWVFNSELESNAKRATLSSYFEGRYVDVLNIAQARLFRRPDADLSDFDRAKLWADRHFNEPCGLLSWSCEEPTVGLLRGIRSGPMGWGLVLQSSPGITAYRDWTAVVHVCMLPRHYRIWEWED